MSTSALWSLRAALAAWGTDLADLVLSRACLECGRLGRAWCGPCLERHPRLLQVEQAPDLPPVACAVRYDGAARRALVEYKEYANRALAPMLGALLAEAIAAHLGQAAVRHAVLVPVPGHRRPARGFDALGAVLTVARRDLAAQHLTVTVVPAVRLAHDPGPIKAMGRAARQRAVAGTMRSDGRQARRLAGLGPVRLLVVDDIVTTGSTARAAVAALRGTGLAVHGVAAVARASRAAQP